MLYACTARHIDVKFWKILKFYSFSFNDNNNNLAKCPPTYFYVLIEYTYAKLFVKFDSPNSLYLTCDDTLRRMKLY